MQIHNNAFDIGNDIQIVWPVLMDGFEKDLTDQPITLTLVAPNGRRRDLDYEVDGNILMAEFLAIEQKVSGWYHLEVCYNRGLRGQKTIYATNALLLRDPYKCPHHGGNSLDSQRLLMPTAYLQVGLALNGMEQKVENLQSAVEEQQTIAQMQQQQIDANTEMNRLQEEGIGEEAAKELVSKIFK